MRGRKPPQTPAEHHEEALALLNDAEDYPLGNAVHVSLVTRAAAHASLALYRPEKAPRKPARPRPAGEVTDA